MVSESVAVDSFAQLRRRLIRETEAFLEDALRHPEDFPRIPAVPVGAHTFAPSFAARFWADVIGER